MSCILTITTLIHKNTCTAELNELSYPRPLPLWGERKLLTVEEGRVIRREVGVLKQSAL